jgi:predicted RNA-binding protein with TRAM domain
MDISDELLCLFSAEVTERDGSYVVEVPRGELMVGDVVAGETYRVGLVPTATSSEATPTSPTEKSDRSGPSPPVDEGERRDVDIEDIGEQGDGIARVERGYVIIVPDTEQGERVTVEITDVQQNVAFAEVIERQTHF